MFGKPKPTGFTRALVGEWRADTLSGDVKGQITAIFNTDGTYLTRNQMEVRGVPADPVTQTGRYRIEAVDKQRFKLFTIDTKSIRLRPSRSRRHTTSVSPSRTALRHASSSGRASRRQA